MYKMWIDREIKTELVDLALHYPVVMITGPRQAGKTSLARQVFPDKPYYSIENPDFNFHEYRSNLVAKWEYRLGSFIYFVWSAERTGMAEDPSVSISDSFRQLGKAYPKNIFLIKLNYWFSL